MSNNNMNNGHVPVNRPDRKPLQKQQALVYNTEEGFRYRVVNEVPGAIDAYKLAGWEVVSDPTADKSDDRAGKASQIGSVNRRIVNQDPHAPCRFGVLMRKPEEWFNEDSKYAQAEADRIEREINPAKFKQGECDYGSLEYKNNMKVDKQ